MLAALLLSSAIAVTFDDLPGVAVPASDRCDGAALRRWNEKLLAVLRRHKTPALALVNSGRACVGHDLASILEAWLRDGHSIGNHTAHHPDLNSIPPEEFEHEIVQGESPLRDLLRHHSQRLTWFRYPMLHTGPTVAVRDRIARFLVARGYRNAVVTIDSEEYLYNNAYADALSAHDHARAERIAAAYLPFMKSITAFFEQRALDVVGRPITHVLLLHMSALNADHLDELLTMLERRGYRFVTIEEAMRDPAYTLRDGYVGRKGISWIHRWGLAKGMPIVWEPEYRPE